MTASRKADMARSTRQVLCSTGRDNDNFDLVVRQRCSSRKQTSAFDTACPPRRSFVASDARRRGQTCRDVPPTNIAFGDSLPTPAMLAGVDKLSNSISIEDT
jgi:hypothetical protein